MRNLILIPALIAVVTLYAQPYAIGTSNITFYDAGRDRDVPCEVHYPAATTGADVPVIEGAFPVIVIGHGFVMGVDAYQYLWQHFVPLGYIVALPTTEAGFTPSHAAFGADLAFVAQVLIDANEDVNSAFHQHVLPDAVLMGHSMGGGAATLGASANAAIRALITLAPAETNPSAIAAAPDVLVPSLVFAASEDCVTPIDAHAAPIYEALTAPCKAFVNITGGGHCYFGDNSFTCSFGELTCGPNLSITREQQHAVVTDIAELWLRYHVLDDASVLSPLIDSLAGTDRFVAETTCLSTTVADDRDASMGFTVLPTSGGWTIAGVAPGDRVLLFDALGRTCWSGRATGATVRCDIPSSASGAMIMVVEGIGGGRYRRVLFAPGRGD